MAEEAKAATQAQLTPDNYAHLYAEGRALTVADALRYAREPLSGPAQVERPAPFDALTPCEREIAGLLARGQTNRQIAEQLVISEQTVETHVKRILGKLELRSRHLVAELAATSLPG